MAVLPDHQIRKLAEAKEMINPFVENYKKKTENPEEQDVISFGLTSAGYDTRIANEFRVFTPNIYNTEVDPKKIDERALVEYEVEDFILIPPNSYVLGHSVEYFKIPDNIFCKVLGKSTYARAGIIINVTPLEPGWEGHITIEIGNATALPAKVYANEGIAQVVFEEIKERPEVTYADKKGKYQKQTGVTLPKTK